ncbi:MAG: DUF4167 domain-containing protein [Methylocystis sp.]|nr:DUF4167 domain-containing protein [Methylocystis sp.]MBI3275519.1 DUF4167 domain-containing protein [Methylocystis sp.]
MRPGQNKRLRGRSNRKGPNPLTRSFESNGPDVKIRGTAQHVAEKYLQLARDAQSSGDTIMAESFLQHAEHYFRLITAAQSALQPAQGGYARQPSEAEADVGDDEDDVSDLSDRFAPLSERLPQPAFQQPQPQSYQPQAPTPAPSHFSQQPQPFEERPPFGERRHERPGRPERPFSERGRERGRDREPDRNLEGGGEHGRHQGFDRTRDNRKFHQRVDPIRQDESPAERQTAEPAGLPSFITAPVRSVGADQDAPEPLIGQDRPAGREHEGAEYHLNWRRRRRPRPPGDETGGGATSDEPPHSGELPLAD